MTASTAGDRFDARAVVEGCFAASALGFVAYLAVDSFPYFVAVAIVIQFASRMSRPSGRVLALRVASGRDRVVALAWQRTLTNLGYGVGGLLAGLALLFQGRTPFDVLLAANAASFVIASVLILRLPPMRPSAAPAESRRMSTLARHTCPSHPSRIRIPEHNGWRRHAALVRRACRPDRRTRVQQ
jgi:predicted MFS family arabinose efflux permease